MMDGSQYLQIAEHMGTTRKNIEVSVILPCFNGGRFLELQLNALAGQVYDGPWELVFVDNGSTDDSVAMVKSFACRFPNLTIIDASAEKGQPYALNAGICSARGNSIVCCDADDEVAPGWLKAMAAGLQEHRFVACRMDQKKLNPAWLAGGQQAEVLPKLWYYPFLPYAAGATLGFQRSLFDKIGCFDETLPYLHDTDFCIQAQLYGVKIVLLRDALLHYRRRGSLLNHFKQSRNYAAYNTILAKRYCSNGPNILLLYKEILKDWLMIFRLVPRVRSRHVRFEVAWMIGRQIGRVVGCWRFNGIPV